MKKPGCTTIQDGIIQYSTGHYLEGEPLTVGYDPYGYNYQAHMFNGSTANVKPIWQKIQVLRANGTGLIATMSW
jgi:hypothetical protein